MSAETHFRSFPGRDDSRKAYNNLIRSKSLTKSFDGSQFRSARHHDTDECSTSKSVASAEGENLRVCWVGFDLKWQPEGKGSDCCDERDKGNGVESTEAVGEVGGQDAAYN